MNKTLKMRTDDDRRQHQYCQECKLTCERANKNWNETISKCRGIYSDEDFKEIAAAANMKQEEVMELLNPAEWIYKHLGIVPYWYQHKSLRCTSIRKALRWGRRTGKTEIVSAYLIYLACTNVNKKILAITATKSQAEEINDRVIKLIDESIDVKGEIVRSVHQPFIHIQFANGSRIRIFVAGTSAGKKAGQHVRGQEADLIFIDEMDYIDDDASDAILPILSDPHRQGDPIEFITSSTPSGKEGTFFRICHNDQYKEFHFPSYCRPDWDEDKEAEARALAKTEQGYQHEYLADWGTKSDGVFRRSDIIRSGQEYRYWNHPGFYETVAWPEMKPYPAHWKYIMGVDWNGPGNGTRIVIVGYDYTRNKWIVPYREAISVEKFSYHYAIERIVEVNRVWRCMAAYIDAGHGQMQDETLRAIGRKASLSRSQGHDYHSADLMWADKLVQVDMGGWIEYKTTEDGKMVEKKIPMKNYVVENCQRFFENDDLWFSKSDQELKAQLLGYIIARKSVHGHPIYKADPEAGDHDLDALMFALYGFNQEFDPQFSKTDRVMEFIVLPRPGQQPEIDIDPLLAPLEFQKAQREAKEANKPLRPNMPPSRQVKKDKEVDILMGPNAQPIILRYKPQTKSQKQGLLTPGRKPSGRNDWQKRKSNGRQVLPRS